MLEAWNAQFSTSHSVAVAGRLTATLASFTEVQSRWPS